jgi:gluconate kinase
MKIIVLFGLPGSGKTYAAKIFQKNFGYFFYDGDRDLPLEMDKALKEERTVTDEMRDMFFSNIIAHTQELTSSHDKIVLSQTFIKEKYREKFLSAFPSTKFVLIEASVDIREKRLTDRKEYPLSLAYARKMEENFQPPKIQHTTFNNNENGEETLKKQIENFIKTTVE